MRLPSPTTLALGVVLVVTALPTVAVATTPDLDPVTPAADPSGALPVLEGDVPSAQQALAAVRAAFGHRRPRRSSGPVPGRGRDLTQQMLRLHRSLDQLSPADRHTAERYLARPTDGGADPDGSGYAGTADPQYTCGTKVCVTWARLTNDAPPADDRDGDRIPNQVERTLSVANDVWDRIVTQGGYRAPLPDRGGPGDGPNTKLDIYLANIGGQGLYGYCSVDSVVVGSGRDAPGYCVVDDDYAEFGANSPQENLEVTVAHEFFHAVQFAYDFWEDAWFMEGTAAWMEDELYDSVNDNRQYLAQSALSSPTKPLDFWNDNWLPYGSWIWFRYLGERFPESAGGIPTVVRDAWSRADDADPADPGSYSLQAVNEAILGRAESFSDVFSDFGVANRQPKRSYDEGGTYPRVPAVAGFGLSSTHRSIRWHTATMPHLTSFAIGFRPAASLRSTRWRLRVRVDAPRPTRGSYAQLTTYRRNGSVRTRVIRLDAAGVGRLDAPFGAASVKRVELTLTNAGRHYRCHRGTWLSCEGKSLDNNLETRFTASAVRAS